jgi:hypothetical protein
MLMLIPLTLLLVTMGNMFYYEYRVMKYKVDKDIMKAYNQLQLLRKYKL